MQRAMLAGLVALGLSGCASIIEGSTQNITVKSEPAGASISITDRGGQKIHTGVTPATVSLKRGAGYFKSEQYTVRFEKPGFEPTEVKIIGSVNGWYFGNILIGGLIGMLAVDPATGAMYTLAPADLSATLAPEAQKQSKAGEPTLILVSTAELTAEQRARATPLIAR